MKKRKLLKRIEALELRVYYLGLRPSPSVDEAIVNCAAFRPKSQTLAEWSAKQPNGEALAEKLESGEFVDLSAHYKAPKTF